jgi:toxin CcdB
MAPLVVRQYDVCRNSGRASRPRIPYFVVLQADLLSSLATVIVAPAVPLRAIDAITRLNPVIKIDGKAHAVTMQDMAGIPRSRLGPVAANVSPQHSDFVAAIDLIFTGI